LALINIINMSKKELNEASSLNVPPITRSVTPTEDVSLNPIFVKIKATYEHQLSEIKNQFKPIYDENVKLKNLINKQNEEIKKTRRPIISFVSSSRSKRSFIKY